VTPDISWQFAMLGLLLLAALAAGGLAGYLRLPKVTAYLLVGAAVGPTQLGWIGKEQIDFFDPLTKLAISLVLFNLGCHFPLARARRIFRRVLRLSLGELGTTFLLVGLGLAALGPGWQTLGLGTWVGRVEASLLLAALALATAPATTILVLKESESEGPVTEYTNSLVAINNLVSIVLFEILFLAILFLEGSLQVPAVVKLGNLAQDLAGSVALGVAAGLVVSYFYAMIGESRRLVLLFAVILLALAVCKIREMPYLLTFLAMGVTVANASDATRHILAELDRLTGLLCVVFFVSHGAELQLSMLGKAGLIGLGYIVLRFAGKCLGIRLAAGVVHEERVVRNWLGPALVAQAGAAIALSAIAVERTEAIGGNLHHLALQVQTVILGTVVVFELLGPILIRQAVLRAGEVPLGKAIHHRTFSLWDPLRSVWNRLLIAAGRNPWKNRVLEKILVRELMRKNVKGVPQAATFSHVVAEIEQSRHDTYPVVGAAGELVGVIRYRELSSAMFDPALGALVRAADITTPAGWVLHPDDPVERAYDLFQESKDDCIPVVTDEEPYQLLGLVRRRDVLRLLIRGQMKPSGGKGEQR
jgi:Kef-type K+ transport system membrane component KefB